VVAECIQRKLGVTLDTVNYSHCPLWRPSPAANLNIVTH
jgi:hypothetical protein